MPAGRIFVCYRREDAAGHAGRLYDRLNQRFPGRVFMDVASIGVGTRWAEVIEETLRSCEVAVVLIGKRWLEPGANGVRRIDQPDDPTRAEITAALRLNLKIVPLLVSGAAVPERADLPAEVAAIAEWQALRVDDDDFDHDATRLIRALEQQLGEVQPRRDTATEMQDAARQFAFGAEPAIDDPNVRFRRRGFFGLSVGSLRLWVSIGVAAVAIVVVQVSGLLPGRPLPTAPVPVPDSTDAGRGGNGQVDPSAKPSEVVGVGSGAIGTSGGGAPDRSGAVTGVVPGDPAEAPRANRPPAAPNPGRTPDRATRGSPTVPPPAPAPVPPPAPAPVPPPAPAGGGPEAPIGSPAGGAPAGGNRPSPPSSAAPSLAGEYTLVSYSERGIVQQVTGTMRLTEVQPGRYQFDTFVRNPLVAGVLFQYHGVFAGSGNTWMLTTLQTNDPNALVATPIATYVQFNGSTLATSNDYGQAAVWRKQ